MEFRDLIASTPVEREQSKEARFSFIQGGYVEDLDQQGAYSLTSFQLLVSEEVNVIIIKPTKIFSPSK